MRRGDAKLSRLGTAAAILHNRRSHTRTCSAHCSRQRRDSRLLCPHDKPNLQLISSDGVLETDMVVCVVQVEISSPVIRTCPAGSFQCAMIEHATKNHHELSEFAANAPELNAHEFVV